MNLKTGTHAAEKFNARSIRRLIASRIDRNSFGGDFFAMLVNRSQLWFTRTSIAE